jgi:EF hand
MLFRDSALLDRIFRVFDTDNNDLIDFNEYVACLSTVSNKASSEDKLARKSDPFHYCPCCEITLRTLSFLIY